MLRLASLLSTGVAAESLKEGMDDILTLHRIAMPPELRKSFYNLLEQEKTFRKVNACGMIEEFLQVYLSLDKKVAA